MSVTKLCGLEVTIADVRLVHPPDQVYTSIIAIVILPERVVVFVRGLGVIMIISEHLELKDGYVQCIMCHYIERTCSSSILSHSSMYQFNAVLCSGFHTILENLHYVQEKDLIYT